jgi:hypothetical protein
MTVLHITASFDFAADDLHIHHATKGKALRLAESFENEYVALSLHGEYDEASSRFTAWSVETSDSLVCTGDKVPDLADVLIACQDLDLDPEAGAEPEEEEKVAATVVRELYKKLYKEASSTGRSCGDWLAEWLSVETLDDDGKFVVEDFDYILTANKVPMDGAWARLPLSGQKGWVGRYRMNGRQALEKAICLNGRVWNALGNEEQVPGDALATLRAKHAKWLAKQHKAAKAAADAVKEAVEGTEPETTDA